ncbi:hypothetical protein SLS53_004084 [Cytospora paraplurivora]|uniref:Centromere protein Scm3 n=1 Tax=Cytospora paraplurivora TaxID=2898453 RepID=A0AAN9U8X5_9PEZI
MEPPAKRQRLGLGPIETEGEDELDFDPVELNQMRDPAYQFELARDNALRKLQSRFENIFAKYGRDFTGVSDEVDLVTGQILVDNGHLQSLQSAKGTDDGEEVDEDEEECLLDGPQVTGSTIPGSVMRREPLAVDCSDPNASWHSPMLGDPSRLSSMYSSRGPLMTPPRSFDSFDSGTTLSIDPAWQAPDLPRSAYFNNSSGVSGRHYKFGTGTSTRKILRKALPRPQEQEEEDEDVLLGASSNESRQKEPAVKGSPLIKKILPTIDSSPNNDPGLKELIKEVIENMPETPPSVQRPMASKPGTKRHPPGTRTSPQPIAQFKAKPRSSRAVESSKGGATGVHLDVSQKSKDASLAKPPTEPIKAQENTKSLAGRAAAVTHANETGKETSSYYEEDLVLFQDVTGMPARKSTTQSLYVEIEARRFAKGSYTTAQSGVDRDALSSQCHVSSAVTAVGPRKPVLKPPTSQGVIERNAIDPAFIFSDEENLPPTRTRKPRRKSEPACPAAPGSLQASQLTLQQCPPFTDRFERNTVDESYAFSDEERLLPRRRRTTRPIPEPAMSAKLSIEADSSTTRESGDGPVSEPRETLHIHTEQKVKSISMRPLPKSETTVDTQGLDQETERPRRASNPTRSGTVQRSHRTPSDRKRIASPELGESAPLAASPVIAEVGNERPQRGSWSAAESAPQQQPSTPQCKSKASDKNTPSSSRQGLISLLSDNEDEEDEISFDLSAFTPSGQHRILLYRPCPHLTTPRTGPDSTTSKKKKRAGSLVFGASSTSKVRKHHTPGNEKKSGKGKRRGSTNSLVRSLVKARRDSFGPPSPVGPVVQTPGGTKRRCGKDGYKCERDFCFICISI